MSGRPHRASRTCWSRVRACANDPRFFAKVRVDPTPAPSSGSRAPISPPIFSARECPRLGRKPKREPHSASASGSNLRPRTRRYRSAPGDSLAHAWSQVSGLQNGASRHPEFRSLRPLIGISRGRSAGQGLRSGQGAGSVGTRLVSRSCTASGMPSWCEAALADRSPRP